MTLAERWRIGRSVGRTIYRMVGPEASKDDVLIGVMDTPELAAWVVAAVNPGVPNPDYASAWVTLQGYIRQAGADGDEIKPEDLIRFMADLKREALAPVRAWSTCEVVPMPEPAPERTPPDDTTDDHVSLGTARAVAKDVSDRAVAERTALANAEDDTTEGLRERITWLRDDWNRRPGLSEQADALDAALDETQDENQRLTHHLNAMGQDIERLEAEIRNLADFGIKSRERHQAALTSEQERGKSWAEKVIRVEAERDELRSERDHALKAHLKTIEERDYLSGETNRMRVELSRAEAEIVRLRALLTERTGALAHANQRAEFSEGEHLVTTERLRDAEALIRQLKTERDALKAAKEVG